jgi:uncharacterized membrane protein (DUF106 family)
MVVELIAQYTRISMILFVSLISLAITIVNYFVLDKDKMREIKSRQKTLQAELKEHQKAGNQEKMMELNKELLSQTGEMMRHSFKPMIITIVPIIFLLSWIKGTYAETTIAGSWFWWYLIGAISSSIIFRKLFKLP